MIDQDLRYRILVHLKRSDMPTNWLFYCPRCKNRVCEIVNSSVTAMTDLLDTQDTQNALSGVRCRGRLDEGGNCAMWFYFQIGTAV